MYLGLDSVLGGAFILLISQDIKLLYYYRITERAVITPIQAQPILYNYVHVQPAYRQPQGQTATMSDGLAGHITDWLGFWPWPTVIVHFDTLNLALLYIHHSVKNSYRGMYRRQ